MSMRSLTVTLISTNELIMDRDNITFSERVTQWQKDPANADVNRPGDDRAPAWGWLGKLHFGGNHDYVGLPQSMLSACLRGAATMIPHPTAKGKKTLKEVSQSGILLSETSFPLFVKPLGLNDWRPISAQALNDKLGQESDFQVHVDVAAAAGIRVDVRRSKPQFNRSHVRVRPMFGPWRCVCTVELTDEILTEPLVMQMFQMAGMYKGVGNWRPSTGRPGSYGKFDVVKGVPKDLEEAVKLAQ